MTMTTIINTFNLNSNEQFQINPEMINMNIVNLNNIDSNMNIIKNYNHYFMNIPFKLIHNQEQSTSTSTSTSTATHIITNYYAINYLSNVNVSIKSMKEVIKNDFKLSNDFDIIIYTESGTGLDINDFIKQLYPKRNLENITVCEIMNKNTGFHIRPHTNTNHHNIPTNVDNPSLLIQPGTDQSNQSHMPSLTSSIHNINDCPVCFTTLEHIRTNYFVCRHHICYSCFTNWRDRNGNEATCPLCRSRLNIV